MPRAVAASPRSVTSRDLPMPGSPATSRNRGGLVTPAASSRVSACSRIPPRPTVPACDGCVRSGALAGPVGRTTVGAVSDGSCRSTASSRRRISSDGSTPSSSASRSRSRRSVSNASAWREHWYCASASNDHIRSRYGCFGASSASPRNASSGRPRSSRARARTSSSVSSSSSSRPVSLRTAGASQSAYGEAVHISRASSARRSRSAAVSAASACPATDSKLHVSTSDASARRE